MVTLEDKEPAGLLIEQPSASWWTSKALSLDMLLGSVEAQADVR
jgi:hypothetical protein